MHPVPSRVAYMFLRASPTDNLVKTVQDALETTTANAENLIEQASLMDRLISKGEARRLGRTQHIKMKSVSFDGNRISARIQGTTGDYDTRITLKPKPGHHCTCPDWERNGRKVGPCKHVLRLGQYWRDEKVIPGLKEIADSLVGSLF